MLLIDQGGSLELSSQKFNSHSCLNSSEVFRVWDGLRRGGPAADELQGDAGASQQHSPGCSKLAFLLRG